MQLKYLYLLKDGTLDEEIALTKALGKTLEKSDVMSWSIQILNAIEYLHGEKIIHRDVKPA